MTRKDEESLLTESLLTESLLLEGVYDEDARKDHVSDQSQRALLTITVNTQGSWRPDRQISDQQGKGNNRSSEKLPHASPPVSITRLSETSMHPYETSGQPRQS